MHARCSQPIIIMYHEALAHVYPELYGCDCDARRLPESNPGTSTHAHSPEKKRSRWLDGEVGWYDPVVECILQFHLEGTCVGKRHEIVVTRFFYGCRECIHILGWFSLTRPAGPITPPEDRS